MCIDRFRIVIKHIAKGDNCTNGLPVLKEPTQTPHKYREREEKKKKREQRALLEREENNLFLFVVRVIRSILKKRKKKEKRQGMGE